MTYFEKIKFLSVTLRSFEVTDFSLNMLGDISLRDLLNISLEKDKTVSFRAAWVFETIVLKNTALLDGLLLQFFDNLKKQKNWSCLRSYSKVLMYLTSKKNKRYDLDEKTEEELIEQAFQWMIEQQCPIAVLVNCLDILNNLSKKHSWVKEELFAQIDHFQKIKPSPALLSRTKRILQND
ncbi:hypothetical protein [Sphingobacterium detergens]|uniref:DNA alkylation repair enzyme n=1 Tax=Sphingobacterium detergens TaxID=1145106 RepID=A0A420BG80_SPHD1|nr:hypothetical protein [Sphingobacterium detergens]RKE55722.1 hypothetical protein DFQ12_0559 [Sphingobacterium detergens]